MKNTLRAALCLLAAALAVPAAWATTAVERTEADLINEAAVIVTGRCIETHSQWLENELVTLATISVSEVLKGQPGSEVTVVLPGGIDSNRRVPIAMSYPAAPEIYQQENVLLFLIPEDRVASGYAVAGWSQGKFSLTPDQKQATQDLGGLNLAGPDGRVSRGGGKTLQLDRLRAKIRETLAAPRER
jgi:hypothetical protein